MLTMNLCVITVSAKNGNKRNNMNKYLTKLAAKLHPELKNQVKETLEISKANIKTLPQAAQGFVTRHSGELQHDIARDLMGHKYGKTYAQNTKKTYSNIDYIKGKRGVKDALSRDPVSTRPGSLRVTSIVGRIMRRGK